jgi:hypothetical protein
MHNEQRRFVMRMKSLFPDYFRRCSVVDIGSADVNGNLKWLFNTCFYMGIDIWPGKNVDIVWDQDFPFNVPADTYISCECLEHDRNWKETVTAMAKYAKHCLVITCASTGRPEHGTSRTKPEDSPVTTDYYQNLTICDIEPLVQAFPFRIFRYNPESHDLYYIGFKGSPKFKPSLLKYI